MLDSKGTESQNLRIDRAPETPCTKWRITKLVAFFAVLWTCLVLFLCTLMVIFLERIDYFYPYYQQESSCIGSNPGLGFRPMPRDEVYSSLIWFRHGSEGNWYKYVSDLEKFLKPYTANDQPGEYVRSCKGVPNLPEKRVCNFLLEYVNNNCSKAREYGYDVGQPCVLVKLNRIFGWMPEPYSRYDLPKDIPADVKNSYDPSNTYITCDGETDADKEHIGPLLYYPNNFIPNYYFPFTNLEGYVSPFVFVQFLNPKAGVVISVECKAWAKNIEHSTLERKGLVHFELMVD